MTCIKEIKRILLKRITSKLNKEESEILDIWISQSDKNKQTFRRLTDNSQYLNYFNLREEINIEESWKEFQIYTDRVERKKLIKNYTIRISAIAASILLMFFAGLKVHDLKRDNILSQKNVNITPGTQKARLLLSDGSEYELNSKNNTMVRDSLIFIDSITVPVKEMISEYNKIVVPRGGEYKLKLSDGTEVNLNSETILKFPSKFEKNKRKVFLEGEAYFDVKKNKECPFIVSMKGVDVIVTGTKFNIKNYDEEDVVQATLVEGIINIKLGRKLILVKPSQQAVLDKKTGSLKVKQVDTDIYTSWLTNRFVFRDQSLQELMNTLARWYDVSIFFQNPELKEILFTGKLNRYDNIDLILKSIEISGDIEISRKGRTIVIREKGVK